MIKSFQILASMFKYIVFLIPLFMAGIDAIALPYIKYIFDGILSKKLLLFPIMIYALQPLLFYFGMNFFHMTTLNLIWDLSSDIIVTLIGILYLKEKLSPMSKVGLIFAILSITFFSLSHKYGNKI